MLNMDKKRSANYAIFKRVMISLAAIILVRILYFIPLPGVRLEALVDFYRQHILSQGGGFFDLMGLLHFGKLRNLSLFALGIMPFINACIIVQIIGFLVPGVNRKFFNCNDTSMMFVTLIVTILLTAFQGYFIAQDIELLNNFPGFNVISFDGLLFQTTTILSLVGAVMIVIIMAEVINKFGIGNGVAVIFSSEILIRFVFALDQVSLFYGRKLIELSQLMLFGFVCFLFIFFAQYITLFCRKIEFCTFTDEKFFIRIRPLWISVWPLIITEATLSFFKISLNLFSFFTVLLICAFISFFYAQVIYQPRNFYEILLARKCKAHRNQKKMIEDNLNQAMIYAVFLSLILFMVMYYLPLILPLGLKVSFLSSGMFGAFGVIILIGLFYNVRDQIKFFRRIYSFPETNWQLLTIAQDEVHAEVEKAHLRGHGIMAEIKSSHFNWGLPIRTVCSGYSIYVSSLDRSKALSIIKRINQDWQAKAI
jgi:preprotein translocase subunit SecY